MEFRARNSSLLSGRMAQLIEYDLEQDIIKADWLLAKIRERKDYAQNLYAALCNMRWCKRELWPLLKEDYWSCSWRAAGGIVADFRNGYEDVNEDYMNWYCSGIGDSLGNGDADRTRGYVPEGTVTDEITEDLGKIGWISVPWPERDIKGK